MSDEALISNVEVEKLAAALERLAGNIRQLQADIPTLKEEGKQADREVERAKLFKAMDSATFEFSK